MTKRAILYGRVSSDEQARQGYSLGSQFEAMREYADRQGLIVVAEERDDFTGSELARPGLDLVRAMIQRAEADALIVFSPDRLTRKLGDAIYLREEFGLAGIELHYCNRGKLDDTAESRMTDNIEAVFAEYWRAKIIEGSRRGRAAKARLGKWVGIGRTPYGYTKVGSRRDVRLEICEPEAAVVRRIFDMYLGRNGYHASSPYTIANALILEGVPTPGEGRGWYTSAILTILGRGLYAGLYEYAGQVVDLPKAAIIDRETFEQVKATKARRKAMAKRNRKRDYLLSGYIKCVCGGSMVGGVSRDRYSYYACHKRAHYPLLTQCTEKQIVVALADELAWGWIERITDDSVLEQGFRDWRERNAAALEPDRKRLAVLDGLIERAARAVRRLTAAYANAETDIEAQAQAEQKRSAANSWEALTAERDKLQAKLAQIALTPEKEDLIRLAVRNLRARLDAANFAQRREVLEALEFTAKVTYQDGERGLFCTCQLDVSGEFIPIANGIRCRAVEKRGAGAA